MYIFPGKQVGLKTAPRTNLLASCEQYESCHIQVMVISSNYIYTLQSYI